MANSARKVLLAFLRGKGLVESSAAVAAIEAAGYRRQVGYQALSAAVKSKEVERVGAAQPFSYRLAGDDAGTDPQPLQDVSGAFAPSMGLACATAPRPAATSDTDVNVELVAGVFDADIALTRKDVVEQLDGKLTPQEVTAAMTELARAERMLSRFDRAEGATVYWIEEPTDAPAPDPVSVVLPPVYCEPERYPEPGLQSKPEPVVHATTATPAAVRSQPLAARIAVIAADLEDAIGDACDACLPHALIKALTVANGAAHRAARQLEA